MENKGIKAAQIDLNTGMTVAIKSSSNSNTLFMTSAGYIETQLRASWKSYRQALTLPNRSNATAHALLLFGGASHTIQDFFSHTNFIELAILRNVVEQKANGKNVTTKMLKAGYEQVFPYVGEDTMIQCGTRFCYPLVSGRPLKQTDAIQVDGLAMVQNVLQSHIQKRSLRFTQPQLQKRGLMEDLLNNPITQMALSKVSETLQEQSLDLEQKSNRVVFHDDDCVTPTRAQLNKDSSTHPLHVLAAECAIDAYTEVAKLFQSALSTGSSPELAIQAALSIQVNPFYINGNPPRALRSCLNRIKIVSTNSNQLQLLTRERAKDGNNRLNNLE
jgi:hypothetical protein